MESDDPAPSVTEPNAPSVEPAAPTGDESPAGPPDPALLVDRLIEIGEWPDPDLLQQIVSAGEAALGPLLAFMRTYPSQKDYKREGALYYGIGILSEIRSPAAIPVLVEILKRYSEDCGGLAADVLGDLGAVAFEPAIELVQDPRLRSYLRDNAIRAARRAAGADPDLRARLAEVVRRLLAEAMERTRLSRQEAERGAEQDREEGEEVPSGEIARRAEGEVREASEETPHSAAEQAPYDSEEFPMTLSEEVTFLISDLADLADPEARDLIKTAFADGLVETFIADEASIEESYRRGGEPLPPREDWLEDYRERYREHLEYLKRPRSASRPMFLESRTQGVQADEPAPMPPPETIRKAGPKIGRNDPCWCGSGKKYKKCHLGKDGWS